MMSPYNDTTSSSPSIIFNLLSTSSIFSSEDDENGTTTSATDPNNAQPTTGYCSSPAWRDFTSSYRQWHGHISILVCIFGCIANLLNLIVLTRRGMVSPTNAILTGLALADLLNMVEYIPYAFFMYIWRSSYTYAFALFILFHANFAQVRRV